MINAYAAKEKSGKFEPYEYDPGALGDHEVEIEVQSSLYKSATASSSLSILMYNLHSVSLYRNYIELTIPYVCSLILYVFLSKVRYYIHKLLFNKMAIGAN